MKKTIMLKNLNTCKFLEIKCIFFFSTQCRIGCIHFPVEVYNIQHVLSPKFLQYTCFLDV
jgi:hypothetical protein